MCEGVFFFVSKRIHGVERDPGFLIPGAERNQPHCRLV
jgi:hypothetical protein